MDVIGLDGKMYKEYTHLEVYNMIDNLVLGGECKVYDTIEYLRDLRANAEDAEHIKEADMLLNRAEERLAAIKRGGDIIKKQLMAHEFACLGNDIYMSQAQMDTLDNYTEVPVSPEELATVKV